MEGNVVTPVKQHELALFPLSTVLFPGMPLPLHIFEERYKLMIGECVKDQLPFGVVLIKSGSEVGPGASIYRVGTSAHITRVERLGEGRLNITTLGYSRFRILNVNKQKPYLTGLVEDYPLQDVENPAVKAMSQKLSLMLQDYLDTLTSLRNPDQKIEALPDDPVNLAFLTAITLRTPMKDKQQLLDVPDLLSLLRVERRMLYREAQILNILIENGLRWRDDPKPFSVN